MNYPQYFSRLLFILTSCCLLGGCTAKKFLSENEYFFTEASVKFVNSKQIMDKSLLNERLQSVITPSPSSAFLGIRPRVWLYYAVGEVEKESGFKHFLKTRVGNAPVLFEDVKPDRIETLMVNRLHNMGYFYPDVKRQVSKENHEATLEYTVEVDSPYVFNEIYWPSDTSALLRHINELKQESELKKGEPFRLETLKAERVRINQALKDEGFYFFDNSFIIFKADTSINGRQVNVYARIKSGIPEKAVRKYTLNRVNIYPNYSVLPEDSLRHTDTLDLETVHYIQNKREFKPKILSRYVFLEEEQIYQDTRRERTLEKLIELDVFKYVNIRFEETGSSQLNASVLMSPSKRKSVRVEAGVESNSNNFAGPNLNVTFRNRNLMGGAERLSLQLRGGYEWQIGQGRSGVNSYELGADAELSIPRLLIPFFNTNQQARKYFTRTNFSLGFSLINRVQFYRLNSTNFTYGFNWRETSTRRHEFNPVSITYTSVGNTSPEFERILDNIPSLRRSFEDQFILGSNYSFTYNNQNQEEKDHTIYWNAKADVAGNLAWLLQSSLGQQQNETGAPYTIFNQPYSQFVKLESDFRNYWDLTPGIQLATRIITGAGYPYGNSRQLPFVKQFFVGGPSSIRSFPVRSIGPGTYVPPDTLQNSLFVDQAGDIKLEMNAELRFDMFSFLKGAVFVDAGNIWLLRDDPDRPGASFEFGDVLNELAVGTGAGLRIDISYIVLRFDLAFPLRKVLAPTGEVLEPGERKYEWTFGKLDFFSNKWRRDNLILNIAIGYPF